MAKNNKENRRRQTYRNGTRRKQGKHHKLLTTPRNSEKINTQQMELEMVLKMTLLTVLLAICMSGIYEMM